MPLRPSQVETLRAVDRANKRGEGLPPWALGEIQGILTRSAEERLDRLHEQGFVVKQEMIDLILAGEKTVTRRPVKYEVDQTWGQPPLRRAEPCRYRVGETYAIQPGRGKKGVALIRILSVARKPLGGGLGWTQAEANREGFECWSDFVEYWCRLYRRYDATQLVDRIEFRLLRARERTDG